MFIQRTHRKGKNKTYESVVLMENYREGKKVRHRTIANLTKWPQGLVCDLEKLLKGNKIATVSDLGLSLGKSFGALKVVVEVAKRLGIQQALGNTKQGKLALFQIAGRVISQGSRNYLANEWRKNQAVEELLRMGDFNEDSLYNNLDWLSEAQEDIERQIFQHRYGDRPVKEIFLYDVTSSYLEGTQNELAEYGYNRDKKKGKKQIVIGLLTDADGYPLTIEVFKGNTGDTKTVSAQLEKLHGVFGVERVVFVGDKGMVKSGQIDEIISDNYKWNYLTTITRQQIGTLLKKGVVQLSLFDDKVVEVAGEGGERYILRKNRHRAEEQRQNREARILYLQELVEKTNTYLEEHAKAKVDVAEKKVLQKAAQLKLTGMATIETSGRRISLGIDREKEKKDSELDGCYVVKTNTPAEILDAQTAHDRYKDLSLVEFAFRTMKTTLEEIRPVFVRKEKRTKGHVAIVMLAYMIIKHITDKTKKLGYTRKFVIECLDKIQYLEYEFQGQKTKIPPTNLTQPQIEILRALDIKIK